MIKKTLLLSGSAVSMYAGGTASDSGNMVPFYIFASLLAGALLGGYFFVSRRKSNQVKSASSRLEESGKKGLQSQEALESYRIEMQKIDIDNQPFRLSGLLHILTNKVSDALKEHGHTVYYDVDKEVGRYIVGDNDYIEQVLEILVKQAIGQNRDSEISLNITKNKEQSLIFDVSNAQAVFSKAQRKAYMEADGRSEEERAALGIFDKARNIVEAMGGSIEIKSSKRYGTHYIFTIPYYPDKDTRSNEGKLKKALNGKRALFVGKTKYDTKRAQYIFETYGIKIDNMKLEVFEQKRPNLDKYDMIVLRSSDLTAKQVSFLKKKYHTQVNQFKVIVIHELFESKEKIALSKPVADAELYNPTIIGDVEEILYQMFILQSKAVKGINNMEIFDPTTFTIKGNSDITPKDLDRYRGAHIAIAEDSKVDQRIMKNILAIDGIVLFTVSNGAELLKLLEKEEIDIIFTDINMPVMDGLVATTKIRSDARWKHIPIISISSMAFAHEVKAMQVRGMNASISKPIVSQDVYHALERFLTITPTMRARAEKEKEKKPLPEYNKKILDIEKGLAETNNEAQYREILQETLELLRESRTTLSELIYEEKHVALQSFAKSTRILYRNIHAEEMINMFDELLMYLSHENTRFLSEYIALYQKNWYRLENEVGKYLENVKSEV